MTQARVHRLFYWLLPLLVMRSLIPVGFMLDTSQGHLSLMLCDGFGPVPSQVTGAHAHHEHHAHHADAASGDHAADQSTNQSSEHAPNESSSLCPFAVAAAAAPDSYATFSPETLFTLVAVANSKVAGVTIPFGPARVQQSRGPPIFLI